MESHRINRGSGGQGKHKGGDGTIRRVRFLEPMQAALVSNHRKVPPFGLRGGSAGTLGDQKKKRADGSREPLEGRCRAELGAGDLFAVQAPERRGLRPAGDLMTLRMEPTPHVPNSNNPHLKAKF